MVISVHESQRGVDRFREQGSRELGFINGIDACDYYVLYDIPFAMRIGMEWNGRIFTSCSNGAVYNRWILFATVHDRAERISIAEADKMRASTGYVNLRAHIQPSTGIGYIPG
jgi:hypothetical protein